MKDKNATSQETIINQWQSEPMKMSMNVKKTNARVNFWIKWCLIRKGKKDGKLNIPYLDADNRWISPTIQEESNNVDILVSVSYRNLCKKNVNSYSGLERSIAEFEQRALEINRLHEFLKTRINPFDATACTATENNQLSTEYKEMLNAKRKSEEGLEEIGIRLRRFNEYQQAYEPLRKRLVLARKELERDYEMIVDFYSQIALMNKQLRALYSEFCSVANTKIAWYWQGVLKKHLQKNKMRLEMPKLDEKMFDELYGMNIIDIEKKVENITKLRDEVLKLSIV